MPIKKILIVDDSPTERQVLIELLTQNGYEVITATNGEDGFKKAKAELPDLVLMDVVMPGLNGYQATRTLTRDEVTKHIPVIVCSSKSQETDKIWGLRQGARDYLAMDGYDPAYGARPLRRLIQREIGDQLARMLLGGQIQDGDTVQADVRGSDGASNESGLELTVTHRE